jgi:exopolysaccharide production protein ExoQ
LNPWLATIAFFTGIAGLFYLNRDKSNRTSKALWLPVLWLWIVGSRPITTWLGMGSVSGDLNQAADGSPLDRLIFQIILALGIIVIIRRGNQIKKILWGNWPILFYFSFCLLSVTWSDFPDISFKRWVKSLGDLVMIIVIASDANPSGAVKRVLSRVGFVLLPISVLLMKYFDNLGRGYDPEGLPMITGVTTNKNSLGVITMVITLGVLWHAVSLFRNKDEPHRGRHLVAQGTLLAFGVTILLVANSATSLFCFILGAGLILATGLPVIRRRPARVHTLIFTLLLVSGVALLLGGGENAVHVLGRQTNFTGRTDIWRAVIPVAANPVLGTGFESFWLGPRLYLVWSQLSQYMHVNEAHNGYLEVYLNLGWIGVCLIALIFIKGYKDAVAAFRYDQMMGSLFLAYLVAAAFYSITEAGFRLLNPIWIFFLFAVVAAGSLASRARGAEVEAPAEPAILPEFSRIPLAVPAKR